MSLDPLLITNTAISTVPAGGATVILWDSTADPFTGTTLTRRRAHAKLVRATVKIFVDQAATFYCDDLSKISTTWRTFNGGGSGEAVAANTWFERDVFLVGDDHRLRVVTGTVPTVWEVSVKLHANKALSQ